MSCLHCLERNTYLSTLIDFHCVHIHHAICFNLTDLTLLYDTNCWWMHNMCTTVKIWTVHSLCHWKGLILMLGISVHKLLYPVQRHLNIAHSPSEWHTYPIHVSWLKNLFIFCLLPLIYTDWSGFDKWHQKGSLLSPGFTWSMPWIKHLHFKMADAMDLISCSIC